MPKTPPDRTDPVDHDEGPDEPAHEPSPASYLPELVTEAVRAGTGVARIGAGAAWRFGSWYAQNSVNLTGRFVRAALAGEPPTRLVQQAVGQMREQANVLLGLDGADTQTAAGRADASDGDIDEAQLRRRGEDLLERSCDVDYEEPFHPAYARILDLLAPDEARLLRLLCHDGPQPSVDVRTATALSSGSELLAPGLSMVGAEAGCRYLERVPSYLNNLYRLGLIWFSREPVGDLVRYQVLEAQPEVLEALGRAKRGKTVRRSIQLTPFGADFCRICIPPPDA